MNKKKILVWGNGGYYKKYRNWIPTEWSIIRFIHGNPTEQYFEGIEIITPNEICNYYYDLIVVAVTDYEKMINILLQLAVPREKIEILTFHYEWFFEKKLCRDVKVFYWAGANVGDLLNAFIFGELFGVNVIQSIPEEAEVIGIGSILDNLLGARNDEIVIDEKEIKVLGTGLMYPITQPKIMRRKVSILALRGSLTKDNISKIYEVGSDCVLADPGLLVSIIYPQKRKKYKMGIIPHYVDFNNELMVELIEKYENCIYIDVTENPRKVIEKISECETIISSSLHGLILADSYGIPNMWVVCSDNILGNNFKFYDYYSSFGIAAEMFDLRKRNALPSILDIKEGYFITQNMVKKKQMELIDVIRRELGW